MSHTLTSVQLAHHAAGTPCVCDSSSCGAASDVCAQLCPNLYNAQCLCAHTRTVGDSTAQRLHLRLTVASCWCTSLCRLAYGLQELDFSNNPGLTGMLPPQMGLLSRLKQVRTSGTNLSCAGIISPYQVTTNNSCADPDRCTTPVKVGDNATRYHLCDRNQLLPCFLRFSEYMVPRDDDSNMRCKYIIRRPVDDARGVCGEDDGSTTLGAQAAQLPELGSDRLGQIWHVDPSYFQYQVCECLLVSPSVWPGARRSGAVRGVYVCSDP